MTAIEYSTNNSGGGWWLEDKDWKALEAAGWKVAWVAEDQHHRAYSESPRFLGALATSATRYDVTLEQAIDEWETITGQSADAEGCPCCGVPHYFYETDDVIEGSLVEPELEAWGNEPLPSND